MQASTQEAAEHGIAGMMARPQHMLTASLISLAFASIILKF